MSKEYDEKVVSMKFDNKQFEANVKQSMTTIEKLKSALTFKGASKGLEMVQDTIKKVDFSRMEATATQAGFHMEDVFLKVANVLEYRIARKILDISRDIATSFTITPLKTGFNEYELKMNSVQTIVASTGEKIETVNKYLDDLNTYSDKTIYSFSDMTQNIGKFTNAGVKLEDAVLAIKGISNEAAISGANANEASRAMYNFAQALSAGYVKLIDWKSIENANMATVQFKNQLLESAVAMGTLQRTTDGMYRTAKGTIISATHEFNDSLQQQWMTTEVLVNTLKDYADETTEIGKKAMNAATEVKTFSMMMDTLKEAAQSGWARTWELIFGDFEKGKELWTDLATVFGGWIDKMSAARNTIVESAFESNWKKLERAINECGLDTDAYIERLKQVSNTGNAIDGLIAKYGSLEAVIQAGAIKAPLLKAALTDVTTSLVDLSAITGKLEQGDHSEGVRQAQQALKELGYDIGKFGQELDGVDGVFGSVTRSAVEAFQTSKGIKVTGIVDEETLAALKEATTQTQKLGEVDEELFKNLDKKSSRQLLIESLMNSLKALEVTVGSVKKAWNDVFYHGLSDKEIQAEKVKRIQNIVQALNDFSKWLIMSDDAANKFMRTFRGLFALLDMVRMVVGGGLTVGFKVLQAVLSKFDLSILDLTANIGDAIYALRNFIFENGLVATAIDWTSDAIVYAIKSLYDYLKVVYQLPTTQAIIRKMAEITKAAMNGIEDYFIGGWHEILAFIDRCKELDGFTLKNVKIAFKDFFVNVLGYFFNFKGAFKAIGKSLRTFWKETDTWLSKTFKSYDKFKEKVVGVLNFLMDKFSSINQASVMALLSSIALLKTVGFIEKITKTLKGAVEGLLGIVKSIKKLFNSLSRLANATALLGFAVSILLIAKSLAILSTIDVKNLIPAVISLTIICGMLVGVMALMSKIGESSIKAAGVGIALLGLAGSLAIMLVCVKMIQKMPEDSLEKGLAVIGVFSVFVTGFIAISMFAGKNASKAGSMLIKMSLAMYLMVLVVKKANEISDDELEKGINFVTSFGTLCGALMVVSLFSTNAAKAGKLMTKFAVTVLLMVYITKLIAKMSYDDLLKGILVFGAFGTILGMLSALSLFAPFADKAGKMMMKVTASLLVFLVATKIIARMSYEDIIKGIAVLGAFSTLLGVLMVCSLFAPFAKTAAEMIKSVSRAFLLLSLTIAIMSMLDPEGIDVAMRAFGKMSACFAELMIASAFAQKAEKSIKSIAFIMLSIGGVLAVLSFMNPEGVMNSAKALSLVILALSVSFIAMNGLKDVKASSIISTMVSMAILIGMVGATLAVISSVANESSLSAAIGLSILILAMSTSCRLLSGMGEVDKSVIATMGILTLVVAGLAVILGIMETLDVTASIETATALSILLLSMSGVCAILAIVGKAGGAPAALSGLAALVVVVSGIAAFAALLGATFEVFPGLLPLIDEGLSALAHISEGIGNVLGSFVTGVIGGITSGLPAIAEDLSNFATGISGFIDVCRNMGDVDFSGMSELAGVLVKLTTAELLDGLAKFIGAKDLGNLGDQLVAFTDGVIAMSARLNNVVINQKQITTAANMGKLMTELQSSMSASGGILQDFVGEKNLGDFAEQFAPYADGVIAMSARLSNVVINQRQIDTAASMGKLMAELNDSIPASGGWIQKFTGEKKFDDFSANLPVFAQGVMQFAIKVRTLDTYNRDITAAVEAGMKLSELANSIPTTGGLFSVFTGDNEFGEFASNIKDFGDGIAGFATAVAGCANVDMSNATDAGTKIMTMAGADGIGDFMAEMASWLGQYTLSDMLTNFGNGIKAFSDSTDGINTTNVDNAVTACFAIYDFLNDERSPLAMFEALTYFTIPDISSTMQIIGANILAFSDSVAGVNIDSINGSLNALEKFGDLMDVAKGINVEKMNEFGSCLSSMADYILDYANTTSSIDSEKLQANIDQINSLATSLKDAVDSSLGAYTDSISNSTTSSQTAASSLVEALVSTVADSKTRFNDLGVSFGANITNGLGSKKLEFFNMASNFLTEAITALNNKKTDFIFAGINFGQGLIIGMNSKQFAIYQAGRTLGIKALNGYCDATITRSPARKMVKNGHYFGEGLIIGMNDMNDKVFNAGRKLGDSAMGSFTDIIGAVSDAISSGVDNELTIRPVLDLSAVSEGANQIGSMLGFRPSVGVMANVNGISTSMNRRSNSGNDMASAINNLSRSMNGQSGNTYNINGITYDDGSNVAIAIQQLVRATRIEQRI